METFLADVAKAGLGALIVAWLGYQFWLKQYLRGLRQAYDLELRTARFKVYSQFWKHFEPFALFGLDGDPTYTDASELGTNMRRWNFRAGGLYLSDRSRDVYFVVQGALATLTARQHQEPALMRPREDVLNSVGRLRKTLRLPELSVEILQTKAATEDWRALSQDRVREWILGTRFTISF